MIVLLNMKPWAPKYLHIHVGFIFDHHYSGLETSTTTGPWRRLYGMLLIGDPLSSEVKILLPMRTGAERMALFTRSIPFKLLLILLPKDRALL